MAGEQRAFHGKSKEGLKGDASVLFADAVQKAAAKMTDADLGDGKFEVSRIQFEVTKNPGPTSCSVILTPTST